MRGKELGRVLEVLRGHGLADSVQLDLGAIRDFDYYTGVIFDGYGLDLGRPLAQGGRYDHLLGRFGRPAPATGFVIHLDLVGEMLERARGRQVLPSLSAAVGWSTATGLVPALRLGASLRLFGMRAVVDTQVRPLPAARRWAQAVGARNLIVVENSELALWAPEKGRLRRLPPEQVVGRLAGARA